MMKASNGAGLLALSLSLIQVGEAHAQSTTESAAPAPRLTPRLRPRPVSPAPAQAVPAAAPARATPAPPPTRAAPPPARPAPGPVLSAQPQVIAPMTALPPHFYPPALPVYKDLEPPAGYVETRSFNRSLLWSGGVLLVITYGISVGYAAAHSEEEGMGAMAVPVLGPWLALGRRKFSCEIDTGVPSGVDGIDDIEDSAEAAQACWANQVKVGAIMTGLGVGQLVGAFMVTAGFIDQKRSWIRADLADVSVRIDPLAGPGLTGLVASGSF